MERQPSRLSKFLHADIYREGKGDADPLPEKGPKLFFFLLGTYFGKLVALNLLTLLLCVPVVTIPASLCALSRVLMKLATQGYCSVYAEYFEEWKSAIVRYLPFALLTAAPAVGGVALIYSRIAALSGLGGYVLLAVCAVVFLFVYLLWCYAFPLFSLIDLPVMQNVRNACYFVFTRRKENLKLLLPLLIEALFLVFLPYTLPAFPLVLVSIPALIICCIVKPPISEYVIRPYLENADANASDPSSTGRNTES